MKNSTFNKVLYSKNCRELENVRVSGTCPQGFKAGAFLVLDTHYDFELSFTPL